MQNIFDEIFSDFKEKTLGSLSFVQSLTQEKVESSILDDTYTELEGQINRSYEKLYEQCQLEKIKNQSEIYRKIEFEFVTIIDPLKDQLIKKLNKS